MEVVKVEKNKYKRNFISITINGKESFNGNCYKHGYDYSFYTKDKSGRTHSIEVRRGRNTTGLTGQLISYKDTYNVGYGSGACMGWSLDLSLREAVAIARAKMLACETMKLVAGVYIV